MSSSPVLCLAYRHHELSGIRASISEDILRYLTKSPENLAAGDTFKQRLSAFLTPELLCLFLYRVAHLLWVNQWHRLAALVSRFNLLVHKVNITSQSCIGPGCRLPHPAGVTFHGRAGRGLTLFSLAVCCTSENCLEGPVEAGPRLGDRVTVGGHSVLMGPISVGDDSKISFSVRLQSDAPPGVVVICKSLPQIRRPVTTGDTVRSA